MQLCGAGSMEWKRSLRLPHTEHNWLLHSLKSRAVTGTAAAICSAHARAGITQSPLISPAALGAGVIIEQGLL